jgi:hypothetical protein
MWRFLSLEGDDVMLRKSVLPPPYGMWLQYGKNMNYYEEDIELSGL